MTNISDYTRDKQLLIRCTCVNLYNNSNNNIGRERHISWRYMTLNECYRSTQPVFLFFAVALSNRSFLSNTVYYLVFGNCVRWPVRLSSSQQGFFIVSRISQHTCLLCTFIAEKQAETWGDTLTRSLIAKEVDYKRSIDLLPAASTGTLSLNL